MQLRPLTRKNEKRQKSLSRLKKDLWKVFSEFIKRRDAGTCFTCPATQCTGSNYHCGHFIKASVCGIELYFDEQNNHGQCARCNIWLDGQQYLYGKKLGKIADKLWARKEATKGKTWDRKTYEQKINNYTGKLARLSNSVLEP